MLGKTSTPTALSASALLPGVLLYRVVKDWVALRSIWLALAANDKVGTKKLKPAMLTTIATLTLAFTK
jgi:hypothetical protein